ncbi:hypothetical protein CHU95_14560 [Niveispirillum lacus]|uniref:DUF2141 domain-containing protein n=1 Tax=Niveispirillum lacus TaxID=1981099 RepID=A0A255YWI8_9PROT|nr:DUF2141 domain-containing protein [Niveispirillum lacus]OYQ33597.1 hypothetical protein CHU95_14560 [Niveispirillum lacus]
MRAIAFILLAFAILSPAAHAGDVTIQISDAEADGRMVYVQLCTQAEFLQRCAVGDRLAAKDDTVTVLFKNVPPGTYAATAFQDMNGNAKLDRGMYGAPSEPWAVSRDAKGHMGPPAFDDAKVEVTDQPLTLKMDLD